jgi:hypothetical protein
MPAGQGGCASRNRYAALTAGGNTKEVLDDDTTETIAGTINSHMAHLSQQTAASLEDNTSQINASLQQLASNNEQLRQQQQLPMQQMAISPPTPMSQGPESQPVEHGITTPPQLPVRQPRFMPHPRFKVSSSSSRIILPVVEDVEVVVIVVRVGAAMDVDKCHLPKSSILPLVALAPAPSPTLPQGFSHTPIRATPSS